MNPVVRSLLFGLALTWAGPALGQASDDTLEGPIPDEVAAWRLATERFDTRMAELDADTVAFVRMREAEERAKLVGGYDALIIGLEAEEESRRQLTMDRFEEFLAQYPDAPYSSHVRFRLADLYYEISQIAFLRDSEAYYSAMESDDIEMLENLEEPRKDLSRSVELYKRIIADNLKRPPEERYERLDGVFLMLGFCYSDDAAAEFDEALAREAYTQLIDVLPESDLADRSHLFLGNFLFADGDFEDAIAEYQFVYDKGEDGPYWVDAMYQLAWAHYKQSRYDDATALFIELLDKSQRMELESGKESLFAPDSVKYLAYSFADMANTLPMSAVDVAKAFFEEVGPRDYEWDVYVELADVLMRYYRFDEAIDSYAWLQDDPRWVNRPENPGFQIDIVKLYSRPEVGDLEASGQARLVLTERYNEGSPWWDANRNDPEALARAREFIEGSLLEVAIEYYISASESGRPEDFAVAASKYQEYLDKFPIADDYYDQQWFLANAYRQAEMLPEAKDEFGRLVKSQKYHPYGDGALYLGMVVSQQVMMANSGSPDQPPTDPTVVDSYEGADGSTVEIWQVSEDRQAFVEAADAVLAHDFAAYDDSIEGLPDIPSALAAAKPALMYIPGQLAYYHNDYPQARERFLALIDQHPRSVEASYAAGLLVTSYINEGDLEQVRNYSKRFALAPPGPMVDRPDDDFMQTTLEGTTFKIALQTADEGLYAEAADQFLSFIDEFPESQYGPDALHNAAFYYQEAGKKERANELYEQFVLTYPDDEKSRKLYFRIAANYEATFDLDKAVEFYDALRKRFPDDNNADDALYNASFLRIGLGEYESAAQGFERYARDYPDAEDREKVHWLAGEQYRQVSSDKAMRFYKNYLRQYGTENPDHAIEAQHQIAQLLLEKNQTRNYERQLDEIVNTFDQVAAEEGSIGAQGHRYAAAAEFRHLLREFEENTGWELTGNEDKDLVTLDEEKPAWVKEFEAKTKAFAGKYANFEYSTAALYLQGMAVLDFADLGLSIRPPAGLTEEMEWAYMDVLEEQVFPLYYKTEEVGISKLSELVSLAGKQKKYSEWIGKAQEELNSREPTQYPDIKDEVRGVPEGNMPMAIRPVMMSAPEPEEASDEDADNGESGDADEGSP